jgi:hypothetical protein
MHQIARRCWWLRSTGSCSLSRESHRCSTGASRAGPGSSTLLVSFDAVEGGALCREHRRGTPVDAGVLGLIARILGGQLAGALAEPPSPTTAVVSALATGALEAHLERRLRAVHLLGRG